jgi:hypothetical protein
MWDFPSHQGVSNGFGGGSARHGAQRIGDVCADAQAVRFISGTGADCGFTGLILCCNPITFRLRCGFLARLGCG